MNDQITINATLYWAFLNKVNDKSEKYQVDLANLSPKAVSALEDMGVEVRTKNDERGHYITCKSQKPIFAYDEHGAPIAGIEVGNGSKAVVRVNTYEWMAKGKKGISPSIRRLVITDLIEYGGADEAIDIEEAL